jgi:hypothetical protein
MPALWSGKGLSLVWRLIRDVKSLKANKKKCKEKYKEECMKRYLSAMRNLANPKSVSIFFTLFLGTYALLNYTTLPFSIPSLQEASGGKTILNVLPHYDSAVAYEHIQSYSSEAVDIYYRILLIDVLALIPIYVMFLSTSLLHAGLLVLRRRGQLLLHILAVLPLVAAVLNLCEDGIIVYLIEAYPHRHDALATLCGFITTAKSLFIMISLLTAAAFYLLIGYSRVAYLVGLRKCYI